MKMILEHDGKQTEIEISKEDLRALLKKEKNRSPFARRQKGEEYYLIETYGDVIPEGEGCCYDGGALRAIANYCADKNLIQQQAWRETLNRLLWRWQYENDEPCDWRSEEKQKFFIIFNVYERAFNTDFYRIYKSQGIYFSTKEKAEQAIKEVAEPFMAEHPDFVW